jgi:hypothetical protein
LAGSNLGTWRFCSADKSWIKPASAAESNDVLNVKTVRKRLPLVLREELERNMCAARNLAQRMRPFLSIYVEDMDIDIDADDFIAVAAVHPALPAEAASMAGAPFGDGGCAGGVVFGGGSEGADEGRAHRVRSRGEPSSRSSPLRDIASAARRILAGGKAAAATSDSGEAMDESGEAAAPEGQADAVEAPLPRLLREFRVGDACLAKNPDERWYSAVVVNVRTGAAAAVLVDYGVDSADQATAENPARYEWISSADFGRRVLNRSFHVATGRPGMPEGWQLRYILADQVPARLQRQRRRWVGAWECLDPKQDKWLPTSAPAIAAAEAEAAAKGSMGGPERAKRLLCAEMRRVGADARRLAPYLFLWPGEPGYPTTAAGGNGRPTSALRWFNLPVILPFNPTTLLDSSRADAVMLLLRSNCTAVFIAGGADSEGDLHCFMMLRTWIDGSASHFAE